MDLTIAYVTSRREPLIGWFFDSLANQVQPGDRITIIVVDYYKDVLERHVEIWGASLFPSNFKVLHVACMPTIWQGAYQLPREPWWCKSAYLNTSICLCETEWWSWTDDRCVLSPDWLNAVRRAMDGNFAVCGSYEKRANMKVENGVITDSGELLGEDTRTPGCYPFDSFYGGSGALPLEWCLDVNGWSSDLCDSLGSEDSMFGVTLRNSGYPIRYDSQMRIIEDRTPGQAYEGALKRADKNSHLGERAKSWDIVRAFRNATTSQNSYDIRNLRDRVLLNGESLDSIMPTASNRDWYDGQLISEFE